MDQDRFSNLSVLCIEKDIKINPERIFYLNHSGKKIIRVGVNIFW